MADNSNTGASNTSFELENETESVEEISGLAQEDEKMNIEQEEVTRNTDKEIETIDGNEEQSIGNIRARDELDEEPMFKKPKKNLSGYMIYCSERRGPIKLLNPQMGVIDIAKALSVEWTNLNAEEKNKYSNLALEDKERYNREIKEQAEKHGLSETDYKVKMGNKPSKEGSPSITDLTIPLARVKRTCKLDPDVKNISKEALALITKSTELFLAKISDETFKISALSGRRVLKTEDIRECVNTLPQFEWLRDDINQSTSSSSSSSSSSKQGTKAAKKAVNDIASAFAKAPEGSNTAPNTEIIMTSVNAIATPSEPPKKAVNDIASAFAKAKPPSEASVNSEEAGEESESVVNGE